MTAPADPPFPEQPAGLSQWLGPRKPNAAEESKAAWAKVKAVDFQPYKGEWGPPEQESAIGLLCRICGMDREQCLNGTLKSLRTASRWLLNNITSLEAESAFTRMDAKGTDWYHKHGQPMGAARWLVNETSRVKSEAAKKADVSVYLEYLDPAPSDDNEANRLKYLDYLK